MHSDITKSPEMVSLSLAVVLFVASQVDFVTAAKDFFAGDRTLIPDLMRFHTTCGLVGGKVFLAETIDHIPVGVAIWYGPGEEFMGE